MSAVSVPGRLWDLVEEEARAEALAPLFDTEPLEDVGLLAFAYEGSRCPLGPHVLHSVVPGCPRVDIEIPAVFLLRCCPVRHCEAFEKSTGLPVESNVTNALQKSARVEILRIDVVHNVGLFVELVVVNILHPHAYIILN